MRGFCVRPDPDGRGDVLSGLEDTWFLCIAIMCTTRSRWSSNVLGRLEDTIIMCGLCVRPDPDGQGDVFGGLEAGLGKFPMGKECRSRSQQISALEVLSDPESAQAVANCRTGPFSQKPPKTSNDDIWFPVLTDRLIY